MLGRDRTGYVNSNNTTTLRQTTFSWLPSAMVARLASIAKRHQKVAGSSPAVVSIPWYGIFLCPVVAKHGFFELHTVTFYVTVIGHLVRDVPLENLCMS
jgi:hypothetical protein